MLRFFTITMLATVLASCATQQEPQVEQTSSFTQCPEQRPQVCTMDYRPVCATRDTGVRCVTTPCPSTEQKTYSNACGACTDAKVIGYIADECPTLSTAQ